MSTNHAIKKIAITGANGFLGRHCVKHFSQKGYEVIPIVRKKSYIFDNEIIWDISSSYSGKKIDVDAVIHCAAHVNDWSKYDECFRINVSGTEHVLNAFFQVKSFIYISSASVYDTKNLEKIISETSPAGKNLLNAYSLTKYEGEKKVQQGKFSQIQSRIILRPHIIYGENDTTLSPRIKKAEKYGKFLVLGNGKNIISMTHIENICMAIEKSLKNYKNIQSEIFNIADKNSFSLQKSLAIFKKSHNISSENFYIPHSISFLLSLFLEKSYRLFQLKNPPLLTPYIVHQMTSNHIISIEKAKKIIGYNPK